MEQQELIESGVADIAASLGVQPAQDEPPPEAVAADDAQGGEMPPEGEAPPPDDQPPEGEEAPPAAASAPPPGSWSKDTHEIWAKLPPEAQAQILKREEQMLDGLAQYKEHQAIGKALNDVISPYRPMIQAAGLDDAKAVAVLLQAHYRLTQGAPESRRAAYLQLGRDLGFVQHNAPQGGQAGQPVDHEARQALAAIQQQLAQLQAHEHAQLRQSVTKEFEAFAKDKPFIDDIAAEMVAFIDAGDDLQSAYDKAVWANPTTRAKEQARLQKEAEAKLKEKTRLEVERAQKAKAGNVRNRDTGRTPTEPLGRMEDTMRETLREIQARTH